jgi:hypothetical protein
MADLTREEIERDLEEYGHHIEERAVVYLHLCNGKWAIDSPSNDGYSLEGYDDGALHEECVCMSDDTLKAEGDAEASDESLPPLPTLPEPHALIGEELGSV